MIFYPGWKRLVSCKACWVCVLKNWHFLTYFLGILYHCSTTRPYSCLYLVAGNTILVYLLGWPVFWDSELAYCSWEIVWHFSIANSQNSISTPTWCIPRHLRPFHKCWMAEFGDIGEIKKISCRMSSSKKWGIFSFSRIFIPVIKKGTFIKAFMEWQHFRENLKFRLRRLLCSYQVFYQLSGNLLLDDLSDLSWNIWYIFQKEQVENILSLDHLNPQLPKIIDSKKVMIFMPIKRGFESTLYMDYSATFGL